MGHFLAVSAFRETGVEPLADAIREYMSEHGVAIADIDATESETRGDVAVFPPRDRWAVVLWPEYFDPHDVPACASLSRALRTLVSTVHIHDGDYWVHTLLRDGEPLDRFASMPDYFATTPEEAAAARARWSGDADAVARALGRPADRVAAYFVHVPPDGLTGKAIPGDEFELDDPWVFTDLWRRLGIAYPEPGEAAVRMRLAPGWDERLPVDPAGL